MSYERERGHLVMLPDGSYGIVYKIDQTRKMRCPCCKAPVKRNGRFTVTPTDKFGNHLDKRKRLVHVDKLTHIKFWNY